MSHNNKVGRPLKYTLEAIDEEIAAYFIYCGIDEYGYPLQQDHKPPTITGLACYLKTTRDLLIDYEDSPEFSDTIKKAKQKILAYNEAALYSRAVSTAGIIFNLKNNWGWSDKAADKNNDMLKNSIPIQLILPNGAGLDVD